MDSSPAPWLPWKHSGDFITGRVFGGSSAHHGRWEGAWLIPRGARDVNCGWFFFPLAQCIFAINRPLNLSKMSLKHQWNVIKLSEEGMFWYSPTDIMPIKMQNDLFIQSTIGGGFRLAGTVLGLEGRWWWAALWRPPSTWGHRPTPRQLQGSIVRTHGDGLSGAPCWVRLCLSEVVLKP